MTQPTPVSTDISSFTNRLQGDSAGWDVPLKAVLTAIRDAADLALNSLSNASNLVTGSIDPELIPDGSLDPLKINPTGAPAGRVLAITGPTSVGWIVPPSAVVPSITVRRITSQTATFVASDANNITEYDNPLPGVITIPLANLYSTTETTLMEVSQVGDGQVAVANPVGAATSLNTFIAASGMKTRAKGSSISIRRRVGIPVPAKPTGLLAEWDALSITGILDAGNVPSWPETSGNNLGAATNATVTAQPSYRANGANGNPAVYFAGNSGSKFLNLSGAALNLARNRASMMFFIVFDTTFSITSDRTMLSLSTGSATTTGRVVIQQRENSGGRINAVGRRLDTDTSAGLPGDAAAYPDLACLCVRYVWSASSLYVYRNTITPVASRTDFQTAGNTSDTASLAGRIGASTNDTTLQPFYGSMYGIWAYPDDPTLGVVSSFMDYAKARFGTQWVINGDTVA